MLTPLNVPIPEPAPPKVIPGPPARRPIEGSALKALVVERLFTGAPQWHARLARLGLVEAYEPDSVPDELRVYRNRGRNPEIEKAWRNTEEILASLRDTILRRGARAVLAYVPARFEVSDSAFELTVQRYGLDRSAWEPSRVRTRLSEIASRTGFSFLDLTPPLRAVTGFRSGEPYFPYDGHWNALGHDAAARATLAFLREGALVECGRMAR